MKEPKHRVNVSLIDTERDSALGSQSDGRQGQRNWQTGLAVLTGIPQDCPDALGSCLNLEEGEEAIVREVPEGPMALGAHCDRGALTVIQATEEPLFEGLALLRTPVVGHLHIEEGLESRHVAADGVSACCGAEHGDGVGTFHILGTGAEDLKL